MKKINGFIGYLTCLFCFLFNISYAFVITPPANPSAPSRHLNYLPFVFANNSGFDASEVFVTGVGQNPDQTNINYSAFSVDSNGVVSLVYFADNSVVAEPVPLSSLPVEDGNYVMYVPYTISGVFFISLLDGISIPGVNGSPGSFVGPNFSNCPPCSNGTCSSCSTVFDTFEFTYQSTGPQVTINPTAVNFFSIPLYAYLSTATAPSLTNIGLFQPRDYIFGYIGSVFNSFPSPEDQQWANLFLLNNNPSTASTFGYLRVLNPSLGMIGTNAVMDTQYLDNAPAYGFSFLNFIWTSPSSYYRTTPLVMQLENVGTGQTYVGKILPGNRILFRSTTVLTNIVVFDSPHPAIYNQTTTQNSTTEEIFAGNTPYIVDTSPGQVDGVQLAKLFSEAIMAGVLPNPNVISDSFVNSFAPFYTNSTFLPSIGQLTGPWYNGYSQALHALGFIYTYAYDDSNALWGATCASSSAGFTDQTYVGITIGQCTKFRTAAVGLSSSSNPSINTTNVTFTAKVVGSNPSITPTGTIQFSVNGTNVGSPVQLTNGVATFSTSALADGSQKIGATYSGDAFYPAIPAPTLNQLVITPSATTTSITSSLNPAQEGQKITFIVVVDATSTIATPTGFVTLLINGSPYRTKSLGDSGRASFDVSNLTTGSYTIDAHYTGGIGFSPSVAPSIMQTVVESNQAPTVTFLTSTPNPSEFGAPVLITADIISNFGVAQGFVAFFVDGVRQVVAVKDGIASIVLSDLSIGVHQIIARYLGDQFNAPSLSLPVTQLVLATTRHVNPPTDLRVRQIKNRFATQTDRINIVAWHPPVTGPRPIFYKVYRDPTLQDLIDTARPSVRDIISQKRNSIVFEDHNRKKGRSYQYYIVSVDALGRESVPAEVSFKP
ncbi:MAG: Ig-like domain repeat protein [Parachlamydiaceae bacterium]|nr:Ig-like domain repeat protein [Parachlamydiaceae bacterium]